MSNQKALITGATGFIGSGLAAELVSKGWELAAVVRPHSDLKEIKNIKHQIELFQYDYNPVALNKFVGKFDPIVVFHVASFVLSETNIEQITDLINSNILLGTHLAESMRLNGVKKIVNTGTAWQHYNNEDYNPVNLYAATKEAYYKILKYYKEAHDFQIVNLELFDVYGLNDPRNKFLSLLKNHIKSGEVLYATPGEQYIDLVHISDVIAAYLSAWELLKNKKEACFETFAVSTDQPIKLKDIVNAFESVTQFKINIDWGGKSYRAREIMIPWSNGTRLPNWTSKINLLEGMRLIQEGESND